jgi:FdhE protein
MVGLFSSVSLWFNKSLYHRVHRGTQGKAKSGTAVFLATIGSQFRNTMTHMSSTEQRSTEEQWIESHPYMQKVAKFQRIVRGVFDGLSASPVAMPRWESYSVDYETGVPLLLSQVAGLDFTNSASDSLAAAVDRLRESPLPEQLTEHLQNLREFIFDSEDNRRQTIEWLVTGTPENFSFPDVGLLRFLGWESIARSLRPVFAEYAGRRDEDSWMRGYCPACGAQPVLSQLSGDANARQRRLACGCCRSTWQFRRIGCPFCANENSDRLGILVVEEEPFLRLDFCRDCSGYLKTYTRSGDEEFFLSDWSTLYLDVLARQQGLQRKGVSLYEI